MNKEVYNSFKLLGYKINEVGNGYFIAQRPDGKQGLFNNDGSLVYGNCNEIKQISKEVYGGFADSKAILFNGKGDILDTASASANEDMLDGFIDCNSTIEVYTERNSKKVDTYSSDGKVKFKNMTGIAYCIIQHKGTTKLVYCDSYEHECNIKTVDLKGNIETLDATTVTYITINNQFMERVSADGEEEIVDFKGNIVFKGNVSIDGMNIDNDTVLILKDGELDIKSSMQKIDIHYRDANKIRYANFTTNSDVLCIGNGHESYLLNIKTMQRTKNRIIIENSLIDVGLVTQEQGESKYMSRISLENFELTKAVEYDNYDIVKEYIEIIKDNITTYYSLELEPIIHEFD